MCPNISREEVRNSFNEIVVALGGTPLTIEEFKSSDLRNERNGDNFNAMEAAYKIWDKNNGQPIDRSPQGDPSSLFNRLLTKNSGDRVQTIQQMSKVFSDGFKMAYTGTTEAPIGLSKEETVVFNRLRNLYPEISISEEVFTGKDKDAAGKAITESATAGKVLLNALYKLSDTIPHEYAHIYVNWFEQSPIIQEGIALFGSKENLVKAIGEKVAKSNNIWSRLNDWLRGLFFKNDKLINDITKSFMSRKDLLKKSDRNVEYQIDYQLLPISENKSDIRKLNNVYDLLMKSLKARLTNLRYKQSDIQDNYEELESFYNLNTSLSRGDSVFSFAKKAATDIQKAYHELRAMDMELTMSNGEYLPDLKKIDAVKNFTVDYYENIVIDLMSLANDKKFLNNFENELVERGMDRGLAQSNIKLFIENVDILNSNYNNTKNIYKNVTEKALTIEMTPLLAAQGFSQEIIDAIIENSIEDLNWGESFFFSPKRMGNPYIGMMVSIIADMENNIHNRVVDKKKEYAELSSSIKHDLSKLMERDEKGRPTGYFIRSYNYGLHEKDYLKVLKELRKKYDVKEGEYMPSDETKRKNFNKELNKWHSANSNRKYTSEYYDLLNSLSDNTREALQEYQNQIDYILNKHRGDLMALSEVEYGDLERLYEDRKGLSNLYNKDGSSKKDSSTPEGQTAYDVAIELQEYYKKLEELSDRKPNFDAFEAEAQKKKAEYGEDSELYKKWLNRNSSVKVVPEFWESLRKNQQDESETITALKKERNALLTWYRKDNGIVDVSSMPNSVKLRLIDIEKALNTEYALTRTNENKSLFEVSKTVRYQNPAFDLLRERAKENGSLAAFDSYNSIMNADGSFSKPASFWFYVLPKDRSMIRRIPNRYWTEQGKNSKIVNPDFDTTQGENIIPKGSRYDNKKAYNAVMKNEKLKAAYDKIIKDKRESDERIDFLNNNSANHNMHRTYMMPQIEGHFGERLTAQSNPFAMLWYPIKNVFAETQNDKYENQRDKMTKPNGEPLDLIPTNYLSKLDNPSAMSKDVLGVMLRYFEMSVSFEEKAKIQPRLELMRNHIGNTRNSVASKEGKRTNLYTRMSHLLNLMIYGKSEQGKGRVMSKFLGFIMRTVQRNKLALNGLVMGVSAQTGILNNFLLASNGYWFDHKDMSWGVAKTTLNTPSTFADIAALSKNSKAALIREKFHKEGNSSHIKYNTYQPIRAILEAELFAGHRIVDFFVTQPAMYALMHATKVVNINGEARLMNKSQFIVASIVADLEKNPNANKKELRKKANTVWKSYVDNMYDIYEVKNGKLVVNEKLNLSADEVKKAERAFAAQYDDIRAKTTAQITKLDRSPMHTHPFFKILLLFRNFIAIMIQTRFGKGYFDPNQNMYVMPMYTAVYNTLIGNKVGRGVDRFAKRILTKQKDNDKIKSLSDRSKEDFEIWREMARIGMMKQATTEAIIMVLLWMLKGALKDKLKEMSDDSRDYFAMWVYTVARTLQELSAPYGWTLFTDILKSPTPGTALVTEFENLTYYTFTDEGDDVISRSKAYEGYTKKEKAFIKMTPFAPILELWNAEAKLKFLDANVH